MKVGTDGVLLGAWTPVDHRPESILDIGAGTGLIALMLAQRSPAGCIDGLEIENQAFEQCAANFRASPWSERLYAYPGDLEVYMQQTQKVYDLIVCNPPFYNERVRYADKARELARQQNALPPALLLGAAAKLLSESGLLAVIMPAREESEFTAMARTRALYLRKSCWVQGTAKTAVKRSLLAFGRQRREAVETESLIIEESRHKFTSEYIALTRDFYLKF